MKTLTLVLLPALDGTGVFFDPLLAALPSWIKPLVVTYPQSGKNSYADLFPLVERAVRQKPEFFVRTACHERRQPLRDIHQSRGGRRIPHLLHATFEQDPEIQALLELLNGIWKVRRNEGHAPSSETHIASRTTA